MNDESKDPVKTSTNLDDRTGTEEVESESLPDPVVEIGNADNENLSINSNKDEEKTEESQMGENLPQPESTSEISTTTQKSQKPETPEQKISSTKKSNDSLVSISTTITYIAKDPGSRTIETSSYFEQQVAEPDAASRMLGVRFLAQFCIIYIFYADTVLGTYEQTIQL